MLQRNIKIPKSHLLISLLIISLLNLLPINLLKANPTPLPSKAAFNSIMQDLSRRFSQYSLEYVIVIVASEQKQYLLHNGTPIARYTISTSEFGMGNQAKSNKTPWGVHIVTQKYGTNAKLGTIFKARVNTGKIAKILTEPGKRSKADNVTTRILWLSGLEKGINKGGKVDSHKRYIYIHGTDEEGRLGQPASHGCIRMSNQAVIHLYQNVAVGTLTVIIP
ncbi:MAG TPA: L,D-transpeptidase [Gammaproteobacteria bacterium]|nr:L,D-transpeptidase [Gammaproteobacteria bacterium]